MSSVQIPVPAVIQFNGNHVPCLSNHNSRAITSFQGSAISIEEYISNTLSASHAPLEREPIESDLVLHTDGDCVDSKSPSVFDRKTDQGMTNAWHKTKLEPIIENDFSELSLKSFNANTVLSDPVKFTSSLQTDSNLLSKTSQLTIKPVTAPNDPVKGDTCHPVVNSVCELESTIDWVSTQLDAVLELGDETQHHSFDHTRIPTQLACIQQLIQTMAPLGGQIRELKQTLDASELPVCNSLVDSGGPNATVEVVDEPTALQVAIDGRGDESLRNHLRDRLESVHSLRSEKLAHCERIVCDLEDMHNTYSTLREQLQCIQDKLALVSTQLHDPAGTLWGVHLNDGNSLSEQIESYAVLERELDYNLRQMLYEVEKLASQNQMASLLEQTADVLLELNDLTFVCQQRQNCLTRLDNHLEQIGLLVKEQLAWMEEEIRQLNDLKGTLKGADSERLGQFARLLLETANRIQIRQPEVQEVMKHLDALTSSGSPASIFSELGVKGPVRNTAHFERLHAELRQVWNEMTTGVLLNVATELIISAVNHVYSTCDEAIQFAKSQNVRVWFNSDVLLNADYLHSQLQNIQDHIQTIDESRSWMTNEIEPLVCSHVGVSLMQSTSIFNLESLHHCLMQAHTTLCALRDDVSMTYLPAVSALHERLQSAATFMDLLRLQTAELPVPSIDAIGNSDENSRPKGNIPVLLALTTDLDLAKVQRAQCQQLIDGIYRERRSLSEELNEIFEPVKKKYKEQKCDSLVENLNGAQVTFAEVPNVAGDTAGGPEHNLILSDPEFAANKIFDGYNTLLSQLDARKQQFDAAITALSTKCAELEQVPSVPTPYSLHDSQPLDFGRWESDSGIPFDEADSHGVPKMQGEHFDMPIFESQNNLTSPVDKHGASYQRTVSASISDVLKRFAEEICVALIKHGQVSGVLEACQSTLTECDADLSVVPHVDDDQIYENMAIDESQFAGLIPLDGVMRLELNRMELDMLNVLFERIGEIFLSVSETAMPNSVQQIDLRDVDALKNLHQTVVKNTESKFNKQKADLAQGLLRGVNNVIHTMQVDDSSEHTNQMQSYLSDHTASSREHEGSQSLAYNCYRRDTIISDASLLVEALRESESLVLSAYELSERTAARILRLEPWIVAHLDKLEQLENDDRSTVEILSAALVTISAIKIELRSKLDTVKTVALESALLNNTLHDLGKITKVDDAMQPNDFEHNVPFCESQASLGNRAGLPYRIDVHSTRLKEMYSHLLEQNRKLTEEICVALIKHGQVSGVLEACQSTLTECDADLSVVPHVDDDQIYENMAIDESQFAGLIPLDGVMRLELNRMELDMLNVLFERIGEIFLSVSETAMPNSVQQIDLRDVDALKNLHQTVVKNTESKFNKQKADLAQIHQLDAVLSNQAVWLDRNGAELARLVAPRGLSTHTAQELMTQFKDVYAKLEDDGRSRFVKLIQLSCGSDNLESHDTQTTSSQICSSDDAMLAIVQFLAEHVPKLRGASTGSEQLCASGYPYGLRRLIRSQARYKLLVAQAQASWNSHFKFVGLHEAQMSRLHLTLDGVHASLAKLYRPSKLVQRCTEQVDEIESILSVLYSHEEEIEQLRASLPHLKLLAHPSEASQLVATIRGMKHEFICLISRAMERKKILQQALKEDQTFETAYVKLMKSLKESCFDGSDQPCDTAYHGFLACESDTFRSVLRLGSYLRDRCTQTDPERAILDQMLSELREAWRLCARSFVDRALTLEKALLDQNNHSEAYEKLDDWLGSAESTLGISMPWSKPCGARVSRAVVVQPSHDLGQTSVTLAYLPISAELESVGLSPEDCQALLSVYGDEALVHSIHEELQVLQEALQVILSLWGLDDVNSNNTNGPLILPSLLHDRLLRFRTACDLRGQILENALNVATQLRLTHCTLTKWLGEASNHFQSDTLLASPSSSPLDSGTSCELQKSVCLIGRTPLLFSLANIHDPEALQNYLDIYEYLRVRHSQFTRDTWLSYNTLVEQLLIRKPALSNKRIELNVVYGQCHEKARLAIQHQHRSVLTQWHQMEQQINLLGLQIKQDVRVPSCIWDMERLERDIDQWLRQLETELLKDQALRLNLAKAGPGHMDPVGGIQSVDDHVFLDKAALVQLLRDPCIKWDSNGQLSVGWCLTQCEARVTNALEMRDEICNKASELMVVLSAYRKAHNLLPELTTKRVRTSVLASLGHSLPTVARVEDSHDYLDELNGEAGTLSVISQDSIEFDSGRISPEPSSPQSQLNEPKGIGVKDPSFPSCLLELRTQRAHKLDSSYEQLVHAVVHRVDELQQLYEALKERAQLNEFNFDKWRKHYLKWQSKRRFRLLDLFRARGAMHPLIDLSISSTLSTSSLLSADADSTVDSPCASGGLNSTTMADLPNGARLPPSPRKSVAFGSGQARLKSHTSLEHLGFEDKSQATRLSELTCSQFVQAILRTQPDFKGSSPVELRAAFYAIDKQQRGSITYDQLGRLFEPATTSSCPKVKKCRCQSKFVPIKLDENKYRFGSSVHLVRFLNSITMVRVGGGWRNLTEFLATRDPCRVSQKVTNTGSSIPAKGQSDVPRVATLSRADPNSNLGSLNLVTSKLRRDMKQTPRTASTPYPQKSPPRAKPRHNRLPSSSTGPTSPP
ncbi:hypothetical protein AHF37_02054 [Paragonimus kellicotti]|nr:hypothetical protein AHF37_02054 [Paragonimus kellicotti]